MEKRLMKLVMDWPGRIMAGVVLAAVVVLVLAVVPSVKPGLLPGLPSVRVDTDPENMLSADEPVRVFHNRMRGEFDLHDVIVVGVVNDSHDSGVFHVESLKEIYALAEYAETIRFSEEGGDGGGGREAGVIGADIIAPSTVDNIEQAGLGSVRFEWLMAEPPETEEAALAVAAKAANIPFLDNTMISGDGKALALYIPVTDKNISYQVAEKLRSKIAEFGTGSGNTYHITGLPVAQDQFGVEMFRQMAVSAPVAMLLIFILMWVFFRNLNLIISPMVVAMVAVILTMGLLVISGNTIHIMSSMIPIFIMPIAVLDAVHILSDFFDVYPRMKDRRRALEHVMDELWTPMFFTSLTTCAGFASLAFTPIPPVQVFGIFISIGVVLAWLLTVVLIPAYIMIMPEKSFEKFGMEHEHTASGWSLAGVLQKTGRITYHHARLILVLVLVAGAGAAYGISKIQINDNPVKWFEPEHDIRVADRVLNEKFAGTYMAYLTLQAPEVEGELTLDESMLAEAPESVRDALEPHLGKPLADLNEIILEKQDAAASDELWDAWEDAALLIGRRVQESDVFKLPEVLRYMESLQQHLLDTGLVGKSNGLTDVVRTVHRELFLGEQEAFRIPDTSAAVAQTLITYQGSHRPQDLWHFVTPDYRKANLWIQLKSGDNRDMQAVVEAVDEFMDDNPAPSGITHSWFGLTYINVIWQEKMVAGMMEAFIGSFVIVLVMMIVLFRSFWWGLLSMIPLTVTIAAIYGFIGLIGKDYDMPVAVLSSLSLGLAVDYAIHFLARSREIRARCSSWKEAVGLVFGEPGRAIARNVVVIGVGFLPLLLAPLVPYQTVGFFISAILVVAGAASLIILPAVLRLAEPLFFRKAAEKQDTDNH